jgi:hypothetical protein
VSPDLRCRGLDVRRFCELLDPSCPQYDPSYVGVILRQSGRPEPPAPAEAVELAARMRACLYRSVDPQCGCPGGHCGLRGGVHASHLDCFNCLSRYHA